MSHMPPSSWSPHSRKVHSGLVVVVSGMVVVGFVAPESVAGPVVASVVDPTEVVSTVGSGAVLPPEDAFPLPDVSSLPISSELAPGAGPPPPPPS